MCLYQRSADFCHYIVHTYSYQLILVSNPEAPRDSASGFSMFLPLLQVESMSPTDLTQGAATNSELVASMYFLTAPNRRAPCFWLLASTMASRASTILFGPSSNFSRCWRFNPDGGDLARVSAAERRADVEQGPWVDAKLPIFGGPLVLTSDTCAGVIAKTLEALDDRPPMILLTSASHSFSLATALAPLSALTSAGTETAAPKSNARRCSPDGGKAKDVPKLCPAWRTRTSKAHKSQARQRALMAVQMLFKRSKGIKDLS